MRRILLTLGPCACACALLWRWDGIGEPGTLLNCLGIMLGIGALAEFLTPRSSPLGWERKDITSFALVSGVQQGLTLGFGLGLETQIRTGGGIASLALSMGTVLVITIPFHGWLERRRLTKERDDAQLVSPEVFD